MFYGLMLLSGCADNVTLQQAITIQPVGFWYGLWHGWCAPLSLIGHLFDNSIAVWAVYNNGGWYWFGFLLGVGSFHGVSVSSKK